MTRAQMIAVAAVLLMSCYGGSRKPGLPRSKSPPPRSGGPDRGVVTTATIDDSNVDDPDSGVGTTDIPEPAPDPEVLKPEPKWFYDHEDAKEDAEFIGRRSVRKPPQGFIPLSGLQSGVTLRKRPRDSAAIVARMLSDGIYDEVGKSVCRWYTFHPLIHWSAGRVRCGDLVTTNSGSVLPVFERRRSTGGSWYRVVANTRGRYGWVQASQNKLEFLVDMIKRHMTYPTRFWNRRLHDRPGHGRGRLFRGVKDPRLKILAAHRIGRATWLRVSLHLDQCSHNQAKDLRRKGWLPLVDAKGNLTVWFEARC